MWSSPLVTLWRDSSIIRWVMFQIVVLATMLIPHFSFLLQGSLLGNVLILERHICIFFEAAYIRSSYQILVHWKKQNKTKHSKNPNKQTKNKQTNKKQKTPLWKSKFSMTYSCTLFWSMLEVNTVQCIYELNYPHTVK